MAIAKAPEGRLAGARALQQQCDCARTKSAGGCRSCAAKRLQRRPMVGTPDSRWEGEADRAAATVLRSATAALPRITPLTASEASRSEDIPESVQRVIRSAGQPLENATCQFMEHRFGADFSDVRIHHDAAAAASASDVDASAYTVGSHVAFNTGHYAPHSEGGRALIAHELAHTLQQGAAPMAVQRACLPAKDCAGPKATLTEFVADTEAKPENISKADKRAKACNATPPKASCTSDGHGAKATALTAILKDKNPSRLGFVAGVFVNKDMPADWGAVTQSCSSFTPPLPGATCTFVPDTLEAEGKQFRAGAKSIGGRSAASWLTSALGTLAHETEHARFDAAPAIKEPNATACKFADLESNLSEMAAHFAEMHVYYRDALARPEKNRFKKFNDKFGFWVQNGSEDISGIVKDLRCRCECKDADHYIVETASSVMKSQNWDSNERFMVHTELQKAKWGLAWPAILIPASVDVADIPSVAAAPFKLE